MERDNELLERLSENQKAYIQFLVDVNSDRKKDTNFLKAVVVGLIVLVIGLIGCMVYLSLNTQSKIEAMADRSEKRIYEFLSEYDFTTSYNLDTGTIIDSDTSGNINFNQR